MSNEYESFMMNSRPSTQDPGTRPGFVAVLGLNLEQDEREVFVRRVLPLDGQGEELLVGGAEHVVIADGGSSSRKTPSPYSVQRLDVS